MRKCRCKERSHAQDRMLVEQGEIDGVSVAAEQVMSDAFELFKQGKLEKASLLLDTAISLFANAAVRAQTLRKIEDEAKNT